MRKNNSLGTYVESTGSSFATTEEFLKSCIDGDMKNPRLQEAGVPLTYLGNSRYAMSPPENHVFLVGESGSGKTRRLIIPEIIALGKASSSMIISDPKGELYRYTSGTLLKEGYHTIVLNFSNPYTGSRWNPLEMISELYHSDSLSRKAYAELLLKKVASQLKEGIASKNDRYWENTAEGIFLGVALMILRQDQRLTFENISIAAWSLFDELDQYEEGSSAWREYLNCKKQTDPGDEILKALSALRAATDKTRCSIITTFDSMMAPYVSSPLLKYLFSTSDFSLDDLGKKPTALYLIVPDDSKTMYGPLTMLVEQCYSSLVRLADDNTANNGKLGVPVSFILDEFANFTRIPDIDSMLTAARSRGIRFVLVCQSTEQLDEKYGADGAEILRSNCRTWVYLCSRDISFLKQLQALMGDFVSPYTGKRRPLMEITDLQHLQPGQALVLNDRCSPYLGYLPDFEDKGLNFGKEYRKGEYSALVERKLPDPEPINLEIMFRKMKVDILSNTPREYYISHLFDD